MFGLRHVGEALWLGAWTQSGCATLEMIEPLCETL
jgi:hypothetical protein